ncbi:hypothetical protein EDD86DRAFT_245523 [Gorgonomyces haynaldii]|nr:hypothetical protein EDD86DRAFT_245523 [Gorgonomyces haynaldii]
MDSAQEPSSSSSVTAYEELADDEDEHYLRMDKVRQAHLYHQRPQSKRFKRSSRETVVNYGATLNVQDLVEQAVGQKDRNYSPRHSHSIRHDRSRRRLFIWGFLLSLCLLVFTLVTFCAQALVDVKVDSISSIVGSVKLYQADLELSDMTEDDAPSPNEELLGHLRQFNYTAVFRPARMNDHVIARISIIDPSNTFGRMIYLTYPYTLKVHGFMWYNLLWFWQYSSPICSVHHIYNASYIETRDCSSKFVNLI